MKVDLTLALLADFANKSADGKLNILGAFNRIWSEVFPAVHPEKHRVYSHPTYPKLIATVARGNKLPVGYVQTALKLLERLDELQHEDDRSGGRTP